MKDWVPLLSKLVWPVFILCAFIAFRSDAARLVSISVDRIEKGAAVKTPWFELSELAQSTSVTELRLDNRPIEALGTSGGVTRKGTRDYLEQIRAELARNPNKPIDTLRLVDTILFSTDLLKEYVSTLGLHYVVFERGGRFDGWMTAGTFVAQLPGENATVDYGELKSRLSGVRTASVPSSMSATNVLAEMQKVHMDALPVVKDGKWLFFTTRGEILSSLIASLVVTGSAEAAAGVER
jgi:hypothetical protein